MSSLGKTLRALAILLLAGTALAACTSKRGSSPFDPEAGHAEEFFGRHFTVFRADSGSCILCHGVDLEGGISKVSCYSVSRDGQSCHAGGPGGHEIGWAAPGLHGATAKAPPGAGSGFASCRRCHGDGFEGGSTGLSCFGCHGVPAPHPRGPWRSKAVSHTTTSPGNADVCAACHDNRGNDLPPGCFNNSLCHGEVANHPAGWESAGSHGRAAKSSPGSMTGFEVCTNCHGSNFQGDSGRACGSCHGVPAPHPAAPWRGGLTHTDTNQANAPICARCHDNSSNNLPPGCFNNSLCHGSAGHPAGWDSPGQHGAAAKAAPGGDRGFASCKSCHGNNFAGGSSGQSCFPCHGWNAPHARSGWDGGGSSHRTTNEGNASVCADCHRRNPGTAGCFNNTLCHGGGNHPADWANVNQHGSAAVNSPGFASCLSCHGNNFAGGSSGQSCFPCHGWNAPHGRTGWDNGGTRHRQSGNQSQANICANCHRSRSGTAGCFNNTLCHGSD